MPAAEDAMRGAVKTTVISILRARADAEDGLVTPTSFFNTEQSAMRTMVTDIAGERHDALVGAGGGSGSIVGALHNLNNDIVGETADAMDDEVTAIGPFEQDELTARKKFANDFTDVDSNYRQNLYDAGNAFESSVAGSVPGHAGSQLNRVDSLASTLGFTPSNGSTSDLLTVIGAGTNKHTSDLATHKTHFSAAKGLEKTKLHDEPTFNCDKALEC